MQVQKGWSTHAQSGLESHLWHRLVAKLVCEPPRATAQFMRTWVHIFPYQLGYNNAHIFVSSRNHSQTLEAQVT